MSSSVCFPANVSNFLPWSQTSPVSCVKQLHSKHPTCPNLPWDSSFLEKKLMTLYGLSGWSKQVNRVEIWTLWKWLEKPSWVFPSITFPLKAQQKFQQTCHRWKESPQPKLVLMEEMMNKLILQVDYPTNYRVLYILGGAGFLPSIVWPEWNKISMCIWCSHVAKS